MGQTVYVHASKCHSIVGTATNYHDQQCESCIARNLHCTWDKNNFTKVCIPCERGKETCVRKATPATSDPTTDSGTHEPKGPPITRIVRTGTRKSSRLAGQPAGQ